MGKHIFSYCAVDVLQYFAIDEALSTCRTFYTMILFDLGDVLNENNLIILNQSL